MKVFEAGDKVRLLWQVDGVAEGSVGVVTMVKSHVTIVEFDGKKVGFTNYNWLEKVEHSQ